ncbi:transmembrane protein 100-like [Centropristis striata]|uniref:transmembrane protein 100-like n=1 Tax=Centropristis striata TaxID=184440 RepID=UPI0027E17D1B|nr:transmembrane protein 100-like [Centropristis striata]
MLQEKTRRRRSCIQNHFWPSDKGIKTTMTTKMETLDPSALSDVASTVTYDPRSDTVTLPGGVVSVAGITVMTGGAELSCGSCMLAFGFWGTLIGFSCVAVGLWDQLNHYEGGTSHLLALGFVILTLSVVVVGSVAAFYLLMKKKREMTREEREDGKEVLVESGRVIKKVTV